MIFTAKKTGVKIYGSAWNAEWVILPSHDQGVRIQWAQQSLQPCVGWTLGPEPVCAVSWIPQPLCCHCSRHGLSGQVLSECLGGRGPGPRQQFPTPAVGLLVAALSLLLLHLPPLREVVMVETHSPHLEGSGIIDGYSNLPKVTLSMVNYWTRAGQFATRAVMRQNISTDYLAMWDDGTPTRPSPICCLVFPVTNR